LQNLKEDDLSSKIVRLDQQGDPAEIHCPVCGKPVFENELTDLMCSHVLFTYVDAACDFGYIKENLKKFAEAAEEYSQEWETDPVETLMLSIAHRQDIFCLAVTTSGVACGPVSATAYVGFMFNPEMK
jgi:hypothetical protein